MIRVDAIALRRRRTHPPESFEPGRRRRRARCAPAAGLPAPTPPCAPRAARDVHLQLPRPLRPLDAARADQARARRVGRDDGLPDRTGLRGALRRRADFRSRASRTAPRAARSWRSRSRAGAPSPRSRGFARNTLELALARIGVGIGEAGGAAPAHSLISDYFPPAARARALSVFQLGVYVGQLRRHHAGGVLVESIGWRRTFASSGCRACCSR